MGKQIGLICAAVILCCCGHPYRVSRGDVNRLLRKSAPFVLVFGSLSMQGDAPPPTIRFIHQANRTAPLYELYRLSISSGDRFYAILKAPAALARLDEFEAEVGDGRAAYDRIAYVKLPRIDEAQAFYVGEIRVTPAESRTTQGLPLVVNIGDDFENASRELHRLYPRFMGAVTKMPLLRNPERKSTPPPRVK
jgi:hypothetical protein